WTSNGAGCAAGRVDQISEHLPDQVTRAPGKQGKRRRIDEYHTPGGIGLDDGVAHRFEHTGCLGAETRILQRKRRLPGKRFARSLLSFGGQPPEVESQ